MKEKSRSRTVAYPVIGVITADLFQLVYFVIAGSANFDSRIGDWWIMDWAPRAVPLWLRLAWDFVLLIVFVAYSFGFAESKFERDNRGWVNILVAILSVLIIMDTLPPILFGIERIVEF